MKEAYHYLMFGFRLLIVDNVTRSENGNPMDMKSTRPTVQNLRVTQRLSKFEIPS